MKNLTRLGRTGKRLHQNVADFSPGGIRPATPSSLLPLLRPTAPYYHTSSANCCSSTEKAFIKGNPSTELQLSYAAYEKPRDGSSKPPILLHHALFGRKENWAKTGKALTHLTRRTVIIPDARNHGNSPSSHEMNHKQMSGDLIRLLGTHSVPEISMVGHGIGGRIGMYTALTRPELVNRLVVISASPLNTHQDLERMNGQLQACYVVQTLASTNNIQSQEMLASMEFKLEADMALKSVIKDAKARALFISNLGQVNHPAILANPDLWKFPDMHNYVFNKPTLFVSGEREAAWEGDQQIRQIRQLFPNSHFAKLTGAGHFPHLDRHEQLLEAVTTFLEADQLD